MLRFSRFAALLACAAVLPLSACATGSKNKGDTSYVARDVNTLYDERPHLYTALPRREVSIREDSHLHRIIGVSELLVNSLHFHAVREPGRGMQIVASEPSGVPQAIEHPRRRFWIGVQWHPEYLPQHHSHQRLFEALVEAARELPVQRTARADTSSQPSL